MRFEANKFTKPEKQLRLFYCDVMMMLLRIQSISYFNVKRTIWLMGYQNGNHIEPSEQRLQELSIAKS